MSRRNRDNPRLYYLDQAHRKMREALKKAMAMDWLDDLPPMEPWEWRAATTDDIIPELEFIDDEDDRLLRIFLVHEMERVRKMLDEAFRW